MPWQGWVTQYYCHVLTHENKPLYAPEEAGDDFWRRAITNLAARGSNIARYWDRFANDFVRLPFPGPPAHPPEERDQAIPLDQEAYDSFHGDVEMRRLEQYESNPRRTELYEQLQRDRWDDARTWNRDAWYQQSWHQNEWRDRDWRGSSSSWDTYPQRHDWGRYDAE